MKTERQIRQFEFYMSLASLRGSCAVALHGTLVSDEAKGLIRNVLWAAEVDLRKNYREYQQSYGSKDLVDLLPEELEEDHPKKPWSRAKASPTKPPEEQNNAF